MRSRLIATACGAILAGLAIYSAAAEVRLAGNFTAEQVCPAFRSFRQGTNPGNIQIRPSQVYPLVAKNREDATHYRIRVEGAARWSAGLRSPAAQSPAPTTTIPP